MVERYRFGCTCSEECGYWLGLLLGAKMLAVEIGSKDSYSLVFLDRDTIRVIVRILQKWLEWR